LVTATLVVDSNEDDGSHAAVTESFFSGSESHQKVVAFNGASSVRQGFDVTGLSVLLGFLVGFLALEELFLSHDLTLTVRANCDELSSKFNIFKIEELVVLHATVKVVVVSFKLLKGGVEHVVLVIVVHSQLNLNINSYSNSKMYEIMN
jgi:hypothetical protein